MFIYFSLSIPKNTHLTTVFQEFLRIPGKGGNKQWEGDGLKRTYPGCCLENGEEEQRESGCSDYSPVEDSDNKHRETQTT